jgi:type IV secretory pathway TraG/TraD family ATPase VirD4
MAFSFGCFTLLRMIERRGNPVFNYQRKMKEIKQNKRGSKLKTGAGTLIGYSHNTPIYTPDDARHVFVCGTTGSGKTVALANFIKRAGDADYPALIVDGKGDINAGSLLDITGRLNHRKLYIINLTEPKRSDKYNPFKGTSPTVCKDMLINLTDWSEEHYKLNTERYLQRVITLMDMLKLPRSFTSILYYLGKEHYVSMSKELATSGLISKEEHLSNLDLAETSGNIAQSAIARFSLLAESELGAIFDAGGIDIASAMREGATILFVLNPLLYPETSALMGRLILIDSKKAVSQMFHDSRRSFFIFDEINSYASSALIDLVSKSRSAEVTCILATQSLSDLDSAAGESFKEQVIENCNNYLILRQNSAKNAESWSDIIGTETKAETTYQLGDKSGRMLPTGAGTVKFNKQYIFHPDEIKNLKQGEAFLVSKDNGTKVPVKVNKPF